MFSKSFVRQIEQVLASGTKYRYNYGINQLIDDVDLYAGGTWLPLVDYTYDAEGKQLTETLLGGTGGHRYKTYAPSTGLLTSFNQQLFDPNAINPTLVSHWETTWDTTGRLATDCLNIEGASCEGSDRVVTYDYDQAGQLTEAIVTNPHQTDPDRWAYSYCQDPLGSLTEFYDVTNSGRSLFNPYGEHIGAQIETGPLTYRAELSTTDELTYLRARWYDPVTGTFITKDPMDGVDGTATVANPYHYADNDPLNKTDPLGLRPEDDDTFDPPPVPIQMPLECLPGGAYPTLYFPGEFRDVAAEGYNSQPWYSKGDDAVTHAGAWATSVAWTASPVSLWDAGTYLQHYLLGSGNDKNINVDKVLDDVSELRDEVSVRIERSIGDAGCNDPYFDSGWDTFGIEPSMDLNWFLVFHNFQLRVHGFVTSSGSTTTVRYRVAMADVYDFDPAEDDVLPDVLPFSYGDLHGLHTAGLAQNFVAHGQSRERVLTL